MRQLRYPDALASEVRIIGDINPFEVNVTRTLLCSVCLVLLTLHAGGAAFAAQNSPAEIEPPSPRRTRNPEDEQRAKMIRDMTKKANEERQAAIRKDTEKLLKLATELQQYVQKSNENTLSLEVVHKAEEIEKLAHSVREKMKNGY